MYALKISYIPTSLECMYVCILQRKWATDHC